MGSGNGLPRAQLRVLAQMAGREGLNQSGLAEILELGTVTLASHIDRLERDGWLERRADPTDRQGCRPYLTVASRPSLDKMEALATETVGVAMRGLDDGQRARFNSTLFRIKPSPPDRAASNKTVEERSCAGWAGYSDGCSGDVDGRRVTDSRDGRALPLFRLQTLRDDGERVGQMGHGCAACAGEVGG